MKPICRGARWSTSTAPTRLGREHDGRPCLVRWSVTRRELDRDSSGHGSCGTSRRTPTLTLPLPGRAAPRYWHQGSPCRRGPNRCCRAARVNVMRQRHDRHRKLQCTHRVDRDPATGGTQRAGVPGLDTATRAASRPGRAQAGTHSTWSRRETRGTHLDNRL